MLNVRNVSQKAAKAKDKKAAIGTDVTIENYSEETMDAYDVIDSLDDVSKSTQDTLLKVGVDSDETNRAGSFLQVGQSNIFQDSLTGDVELLNLQQALDKYNWVSDLMWTTVQADADKYTAKTALRESEENVRSGYFIRSKPGTKQTFPVQACMFIADQDVIQTTHNIIIAEENSELHLITGCATGDE